MAFTIKSPAFENNGVIPQKYTCDGKDLSIPLKWEGAPEKTKSYVLIMDDPDAPVGTWDHWVLFNIPPSVTEIKEGANSAPAGATEGKNSWGRTGYGGPCPPDREHRYFFKAYALDTILTLGASASKKEVEKALQGHVLAQAELVGRYDRKR